MKYGFLHLRGRFNLFAEQNTNRLVYYLFATTYLFIILTEARWRNRGQTNRNNGNKSKNITKGHGAFK